MKKSTTILAILCMLLIVGVVGAYAFFANRARVRSQETVMTPVQLVLSRDLKKDYPATVKEVVKYYTEIEKCFFNEECTEEEIEQLGMQARELYDEELLGFNDVDTYLIRLKADVRSFKDSGKRISSVSVAASTSVDFFTEDGHEFARIYCGYMVMDSNQGVAEARVFLLRRSDGKHWKIYGWENANKVDLQ